MSSSERLIYIDDTEYCWCAGHREYIPASEFARSTKSKTGYGYYCKECRTDRERKGIVPIAEIQSVIKDRSNKMLENLGYDINDTLSVYEQFKRKHNL